MKMKKIIMIIIFIFCLISLVSCGAPSEVKQEAEERLKNISLYLNRKFRKFMVPMLS